MHYFEKDEKTLQKKFFKQYWDFTDEKKQSTQSYLNTEAQLWEEQLKAKANQFYQQEQSDIYQQTNNSINRQEEARILSKMPTDAPDWMQPYHLDFYGGFYKQWEKYSTVTEIGEECPYYFNRVLNKSTWDSPMLILSALLINGVESDQKVCDWDGIDGTPFIKVKMESLQSGKKKEIRELFIHRINKRVFRENPLQKIDENINKENKQEIQNIEQQEEEQDNLQIEIASDHQSDQEQIQKDEFDDAMLDPNAYISEEDEESKNYQSLSESENEDELSFEMSPLQQFKQEHQIQISQFKQMLKDLNLDILHTSFEKELPRLIHDERCRLIPKQFRPILFDEYVQSVNIEAQRKKMWQKNQGLRDKFMEQLKIFIEKGEIKQDSEFKDLHNKMKGLDFYEQLYKDDKEFMVSELLDRVTQMKKESKGKAIEMFKQLLEDKLDKSKLNEKTQFTDVKKLLKQDSRYSMLKSTSMKIQLFEQFIMDQVLVNVGQKRARLVMQGGQDELIKQMDVAKKKRQKKEESQCVDNFKKMLKEKITQINMPYREAQSLLKEDPRFQTPYLTSEQKFEYFKEYMKEQFEQRRKDFRDLLDDHSSIINPFSSWDTIKKDIQDDERFKAFPEQKRVQAFESHKDFLGKKIKREFGLFLGDMMTRLTIERVIKQSQTDRQTEDIWEEIDEIFEQKDDRYRRMGMYYEDVRKETMLQEIEKIITNIGRL